MSTFTVLIPVDGSENSDNAFNWYLKFCHKPDNEVITYHCHEPPNLSAFSFKPKEFMQVPAEEWQNKMEASVKEVKKLEDNYIVKSQSLKMHHKAVSENSNKPGEAICKYAKENNVDLIVMGTRGLGTIRRTVLGSVSDYVIHHAERPVSVIPSKK